MTYNEATEYLFTQFPVFQRQGAPAYKPGLQTAQKLDDAFGNPHTQYRTIHVGGTNGKGSTSHTLAAVLQSAGYNVGLYTSPHLVDFRERIRVNGNMIPENEVIKFVNRYKSLNLDCSPSFFELTTTLAFEYFAKKKVDVAVIEVGLGGRLDSTNIISPDLCVITNISLDHTQFLGNTPEAIAAEKAGIIKHNIPVIIGEANNSLRTVFDHKAASLNAPVIYAEDGDYIKSTDRADYGSWIFRGTAFGDIEGELAGECQKFNARTILASLIQLRNIGYRITDENVKTGFANVVELTGLRGRWEKFGDKPLRICDTGHNIGGWQILYRQMQTLPGKKYLILGFASDKDINGILELAGTVTDSVFIFTQASVSRALDSTKLHEIAGQHGINGHITSNVDEAYKKALALAGEGDSIFVGGSSFVVADLLTSFK